MNLNNRFFAVAAACVLLVAGGCDDRDGMIGKDDVRHVPALNSGTFAPLANESGSVRAYVGTEVSVTGFNLDQAASLTMDDVAVAFTEQTIKQLKFQVPALDLAQRDQPHAVALKAFDKNGEVFYAGDYFVTVPVTDALVSGYAPAEGSVGTEITLSGRNLERITRVHFGSAVIEASAFTAVQEGSTNGFVKFLVPAGQYASADSEVAITAEWGTSNIDVTGDNLFSLHVPVLDPLAAQTEGVNSKIGDELDLTGSNLDLIATVKWGATELTVAEQSATALKVRFPATIEQADPAVQTATLAAEWGTPVQTATLAAAWRLDTTPSQTVLIPELTSMTPADGGTAKKYYLNKVVTVAGKNLTAVEGIELRYGDNQKTAAVLVAGATDGELQFTVPDEVTFTEATEVSVAALYNGGDVADFGKAMVYPFYYMPNITIGAQDLTNRDKAFFVPDMGRVISSDEWKTFDTKASIDVMSAKNTVDKTKVTEAEYYAVGPYFMTTSTGGYLTLQSPAGSNGQLKNIKDSDGKNITGGSSASWYGTSICAFRNISAATSAAEMAAVEAIAAGTLTSMSAAPGIATSTAPKYAAASTSTIDQGQIILVEFPTYALGTHTGMTNESIYKFGYICIHENGISEAAPGAQTTTITFDFYWSKTVNK